MLKRLGVLVIALSFFLAVAARAQDRTTPVAVISLVWGQVTVKHQDADYKAARWIEPIFPGDFVKTTGPGSKLLIVFFNDNHQEVMGPDSEATVTPENLSSLSGGPIRVDPARNPFGAGGVESPFVYTRKLVQKDFENADAPGAYEAEEKALAGWVNSSAPPGFWWPVTPGVTSYNLQVAGAPGLSYTLGKTTPKNQYKYTADEANALTKGAKYIWSVTGNGATIVPPYPFLFMTLPQSKWLDEQHDAFQSKRDRSALQRSDYTDYLLVCAQLLRVDNALSLCREMSQMDPQNPNIYRALTRIYLMKSCPAHAKEALQKELQLGGVDPVGL